MFSARARTLKWGNILGSIESTKEGHVKKENFKDGDKAIQEMTVRTAGIEIKTGKYHARTIREFFGTRARYIVRLSPKIRHNALDDLWINFASEIEWCETYCKGYVDIRMFAHDDEKDNDWVIAGEYDQCSRTGIKDSVFFAFQDENESLVFNIKFKR